MAVLFLLALALIFWQALRTEPATQPAFEIATKGGEQIAPAAVPSWRPLPDLAEDLPERLSDLEERSVRWPAVEAQTAGTPECAAFVRLSAHHWVRRPVSPAQLGDAAEPWQLLYFPVASFLDDDDSDGDPLDGGELRQARPGAEVEVLCGGPR